MTRSELATLYDQLRLVALPRRTDSNARMAAETFNGWLKGCRPKMLQAVGHVARGEPVPEDLQLELRRIGAHADRRREVLQKLFRIE